jgi:hypothetical protein
LATVLPAKARHQSKVRWNNAAVARLICAGLVFLAWHEKQALLLAAQSRQRNTLPECRFDAVEVLGVFH